MLTQKIDALDLDPELAAIARRKHGENVQARWKIKMCLRANEQVKADRKQGKKLRLGIVLAK